MPYAISNVCVCVSAAAGQGGRDAAVRREGTWSYMLSGLEYRATFIPLVSAFEKVQRDSKYLIKGCGWEIFRSD